MVSCLEKNGGQYCVCDYTFACVCVCARMFARSSCHLYLYAFVSSYSP